MSNAQQNPRDIVVAQMTPLQLVQTVRGQAWTYDFESTLDENGDLVEGPPHFGPLSTALRTVAEQLVTVLANGEVTVNSANIAGIAWAAAAEAGDRIAALETRVAELEDRLAEFL